ncbi:MAG: hypothetical protein L0Y58_09970 [Verrucomicrobia subdivision 3 bacterium]|nr:hypothetical protein [Limisphaerales bacterium]
MVGPRTGVTLYDEETGGYASFDNQPNDVDEMIAYRASGSNLQIDGGIGSSQTTGTATCNTAINATDFAPGVDTLITALMAIENNPSDAADGAYWSNAALVVTRFEVQNHPSHPPVDQGVLEGFIWMFAHQNGDLYPQNGGTPLNPGTTLFAEVGGSNLTATYGGPDGGWFLLGVIRRSANQEPDTQIGDGNGGPEWWPLDSFDQFYDSLETIAVPSQQPVTAFILDQFRIVDEEGDLILQITSPAGGSGYGNFDWHGDLKASAWYSAHN